MEDEKKSTEPGYGGDASVDGGPKEAAAGESASVENTVPNGSASDGEHISVIRRGEVVVGPGPVQVVPRKRSVIAELKPVFVGPNGIRAGWRLLIYVLLFAGMTALVQFAFVRIFGRPQRGQQPPPKLLILFELSGFVVTVIASAIMAKIETEKFGHYGLPLRRAFGRNFWVGCLWGFVALSCVLGVLHLAGAYQIDSVELHGGAIVKWGLTWGAMFLLVGLSEEFIIRGYLLYTLASGIRFWPAAVLTSSLFLVGHVHNSGENWWGLADVFVIGMFFCFTLWRTGDLWFAVGLHAAWDWGQSFFYSVADSGLIVPGHLFKMHMGGPAWLSGGSVGPEGSVVSVASHLLFFVVFAALYRKKKWVGMQPAMVRAEVRNQYSVISNQL